MILAEIKEVSFSGSDPERLWGRHIDLPKAGTTSEASAIDLVGWVLGKSSPAVAVEVVSGESVLRCVPLSARRPDIAKAFPDVPGAENSGFRATISALGTTRELELSVQAVLRDQGRVPLGTIRGRRRWAQGEEERQSGVALVSVIIPCYNQARFLGEAIESVLAQSYPHFEVVVIDDGSTDNTSEVASRYPGVRCVRQENQGLAEARNAGIRRSRGSYLVFLDSDDRLLPGTLAVGLRHLKEHPECAFVSGHCRFISVNGSPLETPPQTRIEGDYYETLLRNTYIWMPATVMYRRAVFETVGVFDGSVSPSADYDLYLRIAREYPVHQHGEVVAEYRQHGANMTSNPARMLTAVVTVLRRQQIYVRGRERHRKAYKTGMRFWHDLYGEPLVEEVRAHVAAENWPEAIRGLVVLLRYHPRGFVRIAWNVKKLVGYLGYQLQASRRQGFAQRSAKYTERGSINALVAVPGKRLASLMRQRSTCLRTTALHSIPVRFGDLRRVKPISDVFGYDRGQPIDRYYIENFLARHAADVRGRVLEIGDDSYTRRFGGDRVIGSDVLHVAEGNPKATIVADLSRAEHVPSDTFDCIIFTQTLDLIYDTPSAIRTLFRILKPGGVLLATFPGISRTDQRDPWGDTWYSFTALSARRLFEEVFPAANVTVDAHGNVLAAVSFLHGLASHELRQEELEHRDRHYHVLITLRAVKPEILDEIVQH